MTGGHDDVTAPSATSRDEDLAEISVPALLRAARGAYGGAMAARLTEAGFDDVPRNGPYVLGGMANHGVPAGSLVRQLGVSKQAASQLVDVLVLRGYLERQPDPADRRRLNLSLTDRGREAAACVRRGVLAVDAELARRCTAEEVAALRRGLAALTDIREAMEEGHPVPDAPAS
jgi:DNA-binding MarR family transcriptional regulator